MESTAATVVSRHSSQSVLTVRAGHYPNEPARSRCPLPSIRGLRCGAEGLRQHHEHTVGVGRLVVFLANRRVQHAEAEAVEWDKVWQKEEILRPAPGPRRR